MGALGIRNLFCKRLEKSSHSKLTINNRKRILILRPDHIGDLLLCLPGIMVYKEMADKYSLEIVINPCNLNIVERLNIFDRVFVFEIIGEKGNKLLPSFSEYQDFSNLIGSIDYLIDMRSDSYNLYLNFWLSENIKNGVAYYNPKKNKKMSESNYLFLIEAAKKIGLTASKSQSEYIEEACELLEKTFHDKYSTKQKIIFCPEARTSRKIWPQKKICLMVDSLNKELGRDFEIFIVGKNIPKNPFKHSVVDDLRGRTSIEEVFSMIANSSLFIGFDSGLTHFASMVGCPTISIFNGATDPSEWSSIERDNNLVILDPNQPHHSDPNKVVELAKYLISRSPRDLPC